MPFITVTYPPKYPLTESEKKWLEEREQHKRNGEQFYSCADCEHRSAEYDLFDGWCDNEGACPIELGYRDLQDAAEFSARVAARLTGLKAEELPCYPNFLCPYSAKLIGSCMACYLKHARLAVEQEMECMTRLETAAYAVLGLVAAYILWVVAGAVCWIMSWI